MDNLGFWEKQHIKYEKADFIKKPTIFANESLEHLPSSGTLLDLGAGQGQDSRFFAKGGYEVTSTDFATEGLTISKKEAETNGLTFKIKRVDLTETLPFEDTSFDIVYSHLALHYFDEITTNQLFKEIHRVLKPNGTLAFLVNPINDPEIQEYNYVETEPHFFRDKDSHITKRYYSVEDAKKFTRDFFTPILLDNNGRSHKDIIETLIRFIGTKK